MKLGTGISTFVIGTLKCIPLLFVGMAIPISSVTADNSIESDETPSNTPHQPRLFLPDLYNPYYQNYVLFGADSDSTDVDNDEDEKNVDIKFQISFVSQINIGASRLDNDIGEFSGTVSDFLGPWFFGYTQESYWDIGKDSSPFRESNYRPEFFFRAPLSHRLGKNANLFYGWIHESNGRDGDESGGWDRLFIRYNDSFGRRMNESDNTILNSMWNVDLRVWDIYSESKRNKDIWRYAGSAELIVNFQHENACPFSSRTCSIALTLRKGGKIDDTSHGLVQLEHRFPITATGVKLVTQITSGYGHSIERYNRHESAIRIGFQFSEFFVPHP